MNNDKLYNLEWIKLLEDEQKNFIKRLAKILDSIHEVDNDVLYKKADVMLSSLFDDESQYLFAQELEIYLDQRVEEILKFTLQKSHKELSYQIDKLKAIFILLIHKIDVFEYNELISISEKLIIEEIKNHCQKRNAFKKHNPFICCLGLLGEIAVKKYLRDTLTRNDDKSDILTPINLEIYQNKGDGKRDFFSRLYSEFGIQVKTTRLETANASIENLEWQISQEEIQKNKVLICVFAFKKFDKYQINSLKYKSKQNYIDNKNSNIESKLHNYIQNHNQLCIGGFIPVDLIKQKNLDKKDKGKYLIKLKDLLYCGGFISYLLQPNISNYAENTKDLESCCQIIGEFYYHCGLYEKALEKYNYALKFDLNSHIFYSERAACYIMLEKNKHHERFKTRFLGDSYQELVNQKIELHLQEKKPLPLIFGQLSHDIINEMIDKDIYLDQDLEDFISHQIKSVYNEINKQYPISNIQPVRKTQSYVASHNKLYWQAVKDTTLSILRCPNYIPAYINRGLAYKCLAEDSWNKVVEIQLGEKAIENYSLAIELANSSIDTNKAFSAVAYYYRGLAYLYCCRRLEYLEDKADYSKASEDCIKAAKLFDEIGWVNSADAAIFQINIHVPF